jgi:hypothetical protein
VVKNENGSRVEAKFDRPTKDFWPAGHLLPPFSLSPPLSTFLAQPSHIWDKVEGQWPHGLAACPPYLDGRPSSGSLIKGLPMGTSSFIPQAHKQPQIS